MDAGQLGEFTAELSGFHPQQPPRELFDSFDPANSVGFLSNFVLHPGEQK